MTKTPCIICIETYNARDMLYEKFLFLEKLASQYQIKIFIFHKYDISHTSFTHISFTRFYSISDILWDLKKHVFHYNVLSIQSHNDFFLPELENIKKILWVETSTWPKVLNNKLLQRKILNTVAPQFYTKIFSTYKRDDIFIDKPYIYKNIVWLDSIEVQKVYPGSQNNFSNSHWILEEFIEWIKYSIDYFVNSQWDITYISPIVLWKSGYDIWIEDFFVFLWYMSSNPPYIHQSEECIVFLSTCIKAFRIRNTFIHHEFFIDIYWKYKHIEINARHGYNRIQMVYEATWYNMLEAYLWNIPFYQNHIPNLDYAVIKLYPRKKGILKGFSERKLHDVQRLESFLSYEVSEESIWKAVWLSKEWFSNLGNIKLRSNNTETIQSDIETIQGFYDQIVLLE